MYFITCNKHNIQGVGCTTDLQSRISNYMNQHEKKNRSCGITEHFLEDGHAFEENFRILPIVRLVYPSVTMAKRRKRLEEFELYWQENLITHEPYGMNKAVELERTRVKIRNRKKSKQH